jgi:hypothetical protein
LTSSGTEKSKRITVYTAEAADRRSWTVKEKVIPPIRPRADWSRSPAQRGRGYVQAWVYAMKVYDIYLGYLVEWTDGIESWETRTSLQNGLSGDDAGGVARWCNRIDEFMADDQPNLLDFLRSHSDGIIVGAGADLDGLCGFRGVDYVLTYLGAPAFVNDKMIDDFCSWKLRESDGRIDLWATGMTFNQLKSFIYRMPSISESFRIGPNIYRGYRCGWQAVEMAIVEDGVYLVCGESPLVKTGHVIAVRKTGSACVARDQRGETLLSEQTWLHTISYVRQAWWVSP